MDAIITYIEGLFLGIPDSPKKEQLKNDLLANMEDRYEELIVDGKEENEAIGITIKEFGSMDEILEELDLPQKEENLVTTPMMYGEEILEEEAENFFTVFQKAASGIAAGVLLSLLSIAAFLFFVSYSEILIGFAVALIFVAVAVGLFITFGMSLNAINQTFDDRPISEKVSQRASQLKAGFRRTFVVCIVSGVFLCIASIALLFIVGALSTFGFGVLWMFLTLSFGVFLLVYGGMVQSSYTRLTDGRIFIADEDNLGPRAKHEEMERNKELTFLQRILEDYFWQITVVVYLVWSVIYQDWSVSWIIFPIVALLHNLISKT